MALYHGISINFGISSSLAGVTGVFQTKDHSFNIEHELVRDGFGEFVQKTYFGTADEGTIEWIVTAAGGPDGKAVPTLPALGGMIVLTDTNDTSIAATTWLVDNVSTRGSNTTALRATAKLTKYPLITS